MTLRGEFPMLASPPHCIHPERLSCNHGEGFQRCEHMVCFGVGSWRCMANTKEQPR
jgi:hypothetical protein